MSRNLEDRTRRRCLVPIIWAAHRSRHYDSESLIHESKGTYRINASLCTKRAMWQKSKRWAKLSCNACFNYTKTHKLRTRIRRVETRRVVQNIMKNSSFVSASDIATTDESNKTYEKQNLVERVKAFVDFYELQLQKWNCKNGTAKIKKLQGLETGENSTPDSFLSQFAKLYRESPGFSNSLLVGLARAVLARMDGYVNAPVQEDVTALVKYSTLLRPYMPTWGEA
eukprot:GHVU01056483.1.p1 GENE.GHVU01056483.1~~GHVU01056483.1.p1  ORF type:complete len:226 (+),score=11.74 GHVU01056483.1:59-736(+)